ncbi:hypothetical protein GC097_18395 [Paenibacillus sp. LMG 31457]|uniref:Uncharacterized protein n=1 Tax=Paenibacillus planticolens TaxID=2654976 RepID=A0ABX1ZPG0_9BACL|nr:hypothetical protein [Paenibacillus planticolens]
MHPTPNPQPPTPNPQPQPPNAKPAHQTIPDLLSPLRGIIPSAIIPQTCPQNVQAKSERHIRKSFAYIVVG